MTTTCGTQNFVAGSYAGEVIFYGEGSWLDVGATDDGFEIEQNISIQEITEDRYGDSVVNGIYRGGNVFVNATMLAFSIAGADRLRAAWSDVYTGQYANDGEMGTIGCTMYPGYTFQLRLSRVAMLTAGVHSGAGVGNDTPPNTYANSPLFYDFPVCVVDPNFPIRYNLNSRLRVLPLRFRVLPFDYSQAQDGSEVRWFKPMDTLPPVRNPVGG